MRLISLVFLVVVVAAAVAFVMQNESEHVTVTFFNYSLTTEMPKLVGAVFGLGMVAGWSIVGLLRRSLARVTEPTYRQSYQAR